MLLVYFQFVISLPLFSSTYYKSLLCLDRSMFGVLSACLSSTELSGPLSAPAVTSNTEYHNTPLVFRYMFGVLSVRFLHLAWSAHRL